MTFIFFFISFIILISTIGFGLIFTGIFKFQKFNYNYGLVGLLGLFSLSTISSYTHLFFAHSYIHNIIILLLGIIGFLFYGRNKIKDIRNIFYLFSLLFICLLMSKTNEDFGYYHLPNALQFAQQKLQFGLGNLNHGFKHISSIFMLMSINYLPFFEYKLFNLTNFLFLIFFIYFLLQEIYLKNNLNLNISTICLSIFLILFLSKFSRLAEYGSDISGQIVILVSFFYILEFTFNEKTHKQKLNYLKLSLILIVFAITLKFISIIYSLFFLIFFLTKSKKKIFLSLVKSYYILVIALPLTIFLILNFSSTGCIIYPVEKLCFPNLFDWALNPEIIKHLNLHYELWAKGGLGPNYSVENKEEYSKFINWVPNWFSVYFIGKFSDYLLVIIFIIIIFSLFYFKEIFLIKKKKLNYKTEYLILNLVLITIFLIWFFNFPSLRYAGYVVVLLILIFPFSTYLNKKINFSKKENLKKLTLIFLISYSIFLYKNTIRINEELKISNEENHNFKNFPFFWVNIKKFENIEINGHQLSLTKGKCWTVPSTCVRNSNNLKISKKNNYIFYSKNK